MKRIMIIALIAALLLLPMTAYAEKPKDIDEDLFTIAKETVVSLANDDFEQISLELTLSTGIAPTTEELELFAENFLTLSPATVQSEISVAYWTEEGWLLAVPVTLPAEEEITDPEKPTEAMVFASKDGVAFDSYCYMLWEDVVSAYEASEYVIWNKEYIPGQLTIIVD